MNKNAVTMTVELVLVDGLVDRDATLAACESELALKATEVETQNSQISAAVHSVFDQAVPGTPLTYDTIASLAAQQLGGKAENLPYLKGRITDWVRSNADSKKKPLPGSLFVVQLGVNGGVRRRSDIPVASETATTGQA